MTMKNFDIDKSPKINSGFKAPDSYFDHFSEKLFNKIEQEEKPVIPLFKKHYKELLAVAAVLVIGLLIPFSRMDSKEINAIDIENYFAYHANMSQYELVKNLNEDEIAKIDLNYELDSDDVADFLSSHSNVELLLNE